MNAELDRLKRELVGVPGAPPAAPARLGRYEILREVGRGGMGVVYEGFDPHLRRRVALKVLREDEARPVTIERLRREAVAAARLRHPDIVAVHEVGTHGAFHYIAMDFIGGPTLADAMPGLPRRERVRILETVARAVAHAHAHGVVHRDLKPQNILLEDGRPVVVDFGLAKLPDAQEFTRAGSVIGTPQYMAPEQVRGDVRETGPAADVWSLGVILYEMITGRRPFDAATAIEVQSRVLRRDPMPPRRIVRALHPDLETVCLRALEKEAPRRYASAHEFADDLRRYLHDEPVAARPSRPLTRWMRRLRRDPARLGWMAAALFLATGAALGVLWVRRERMLRRSAETRTSVEQARRAVDAWAQQRYGKPHDVTPWRTELDHGRVLLEKTVVLDAGAHAAWAELGWVRLQLGDDNGARIAIGEAVRLAPGEGEYRWRLGRASLDTPERAEAEFRAALARGWRHTWEEEYVRAFIAWREGRQSEARELARALAATHPLGGEEAWMLLGAMTDDVEARIGCFERAAEGARSWAAACAASARARLERACALEREGRPAAEVEAVLRRAIERAEAAIGIDPALGDGLRADIDRARRGFLRLQ